jgi:ABC-2 type transport system permease protein
MPVYDLGYRAYRGRLKGRLFRWWPIAWRSFRTAMGWPFWVVSVLATVPLFFRLVQAYFTGLSKDPAQLTSLEARIAQFANRILPDTFGYGDNLFYSLLSGEIFPAVLLLWVVGAGQIAEDFRTGALQIYFAKPITQLDYILGKLGATLLAAWWITLLPGIILLVGVAAFAPDWTFLTENPWLPLKILAFSTMIGITLGSLVLAISSFAKSGRMAGITFFGIYIFTAVLGQVLPEILLEPDWKAAYLKGSLDAAGHRFFPGAALPTVAGGTATLVVAGVVLASFFAFVRKVDAVEVVS